MEKKMDTKEQAEMVCKFKTIAFCFKDDGSLVAINQKGQKYTFTAEQVKAVAGKMAEKPAQLKKK
jgi:hypothetical protein